MGEHLYAEKRAFGIRSAFCKLLKGIHVFRSIPRSYAVLTHQRRDLYAHESTLKIVSASLNPQRGEEIKNDRGSSPRCCVVTRQPAGTPWLLTLSAMPAIHCSCGLVVEILVGMVQLEAC